jgi:hypothetical protein
MGDEMDDPAPKLGFSVRVTRDEYTHKVTGCALECIGVAMLVEGGLYRFLSVTPPCTSLKELELSIDRLLDQLNTARKEAREAFRTDG